MIIAHRKVRGAQRENIPLVQIVSELGGERYSESAPGVAALV